MPTYSYVCGACGGSFEIEQRIVEDPIKICTLCGKPDARRQIVSGNFILKGGGWYSDGYGSSSSKAKSEAKTETSAAKAATSTPSKSESSSTSSSDSSSSGAGSSSTSTSSDSSKGSTKAASAD